MEEKLLKELAIACKRLLAKEESHNVIIPKVLEREFNSIQNILNKLEGKTPTPSITKEVGDLS